MESSYVRRLARSRQQVQSVAYAGRTDSPANPHARLAGSIRSQSLNRSDRELRCFPAGMAAALGANNFAARQGCHFENGFEPERRSLVRLLFSHRFTRCSVWEVVGIQRSPPSRFKSAMLLFLVAATPVISANRQWRHRSINIIHLY